MITERAIHGPVSSKNKETIEKMHGDLTKVIEEFMRAIDVEVLLLAKKHGKCSLSKLARIILSSFA